MLVFLFSAFCVSDSLSANFESALLSVVGKTKKEVPTVELHKLLAEKGLAHLFPDEVYVFFFVTGIVIHANIMSGRCGRKSTLSVKLRAKRKPARARRILLCTWI